MGSGKTSWAFQELFNKNLDENILYISPFLSEIEGENGRIPQAIKCGEIMRDIVTPKNMGCGKLGNIANLLTNQMDIASTHALFRMFDDDCKQALSDNDYTLILDETLDCVERYSFGRKEKKTTKTKEKREDMQFLIEQKQIEIDSNGLVRWIGTDKNIIYNEVRTLARNEALFRVDDGFYVWHFPVSVFKLFKKVYILTYMFDGSLMKYYFDMYNIDYDTKSISGDKGSYKLVNYNKPDIKPIRDRLNIYKGNYNNNIPQKENVLSTTWSKSTYNQKYMKLIKNNMYSYVRNEIKAKSNDVMWTSIKESKKKLQGKGYTKGFLACNIRAQNDFRDKTCLMYAVNWYVNPEILKFFTQHGIIVNQDKIALSTMLQWIWRSNIREPNSDNIINIYIPSSRMRRLLFQWLSE